MSPKAKTLHETQKELTKRTFQIEQKTAANTPTQLALANFLRNSRTLLRGAWIAAEIPPPAEKRQRCKKRRGVLVLRLYRPRF